MRPSAALPGRAVLLLAPLLAAALFGTDYQLRLGAEVLVLGTAVMSLDLLVGFGGLVSLGHAALFGGAAYAAGLAAFAWGGNLLILLPVGIGAGALAGAAMGAAIARTGTLFLLVLTLLLNQVAYELVLHWRDVTGGSDGLRGLPPLRLGPWPVTDARSLFLLAALLAGTGLLVARSLVRAPLGRAMLGMREQPLRMDALGYRIGHIRLLAMAASGALAGAAGTLHPFLNLYLGPQSVHWTLSATMVVMLVIGGVGTLWGAFLGTALFLGIQTVLSSYTERWMLLVGLVFVLTVLLVPQGIAGSLAGAMSRRSARP